MKVLVIIALCFFILQTALSEDKYESFESYVEDLKSGNMKGEARECIPLYNDCKEFKYNNNCCKDPEKKYQYKCSCIMCEGGEEQCTCQRKETVENMMKCVRFVKKVVEKVG
uniref:Latartoxin-2b n=1 Tax=Lachesana tarabaevi TaxID=379576 RepID=LTX2B_LACTA|nr:RecName: Full=Latartoxin-2b; Short=LtTx-2b; Flags: Precursor [Lachesana tarabaevi]AFX65330.1 precursor toxin Tx 2b-1 [Lachesana tarabaevi]AFX65331.1 precursor toxin Tx 2b-2 [Lachesana tarabaevi]